MRALLSGLVRLCVIACCYIGHAGTFVCDFNNGMPTNTAVFGNASVDNKGGVNGSGVLKLTVARPSQLGSFVIHQLDGNARTASFIATFKAHIGSGSAADGMTFHYGAVPDAPFADSSGAGLTVVFDTYKNSKEIAPGIRIHSHKGPKHEVSVPNLRNDGFVDVMIKLDPDGTLDVLYDNEMIFTNASTTAVNAAGVRFGFGARTGSRTDEHFIDDLKIVTETAPRPFVDSFAPTGNDVSTVPVFDFVIRPAQTKGATLKVKDGSVKLAIDGAPVAPEVSLAGGDSTRVQYDSERVFEPGTTHTVALEFSNTGKPAGKTQFSYKFKVTSQVYLSK